MKPHHNHDDKNRACHSPSTGPVFRYQKYQTFVDIQKMMMSKIRTFSIQEDTPKPVQKSEHRKLFRDASSVLKTRGSIRRSRFYGDQCMGDWQGKKDNGEFPSARVRGRI